MRDIEQYVIERQKTFAQHSLFQRFSIEPGLASGLPVMELLAFWVVVFQDILRINERKARGMPLHDLILAHMEEDSGHDCWYLNDCEEMLGGAPDFMRLFGSDHEVTRDASYALMAEVFQCQSNVERLVLVRAIEAAGHVFFAHFAAYLERIGVSERLAYFSHHHLEVELDHDMFDDQSVGRIASIRLTEAQRDRSRALVDRAFAAFYVMFDGLDAAAAACDPPLVAAVSAA